MTETEQELQPRDTGGVDPSARIQKRNRERWLSFTAMMTALGIAAAVTVLRIKPPSNASASDKSTAPTDQPTPIPTTASSTAPVNSESGGPAGLRVMSFTDSLADGFKINCATERQVTVRSANDTLTTLAVIGLRPGRTILRRDIIQANLDFNQLYEGLELGDYQNMRPGDSYSLIGNCALTSPTTAEGQYWVELQYDQSITTYDASTGLPIGSHF